MPILDSTTGKIRKDYTEEELIEKTREMRAYGMLSITVAKSGHPGGTLSIMDIAAVLYLKKIRHDPMKPAWDGRDRVFWSAGHKAPALYAALGAAGYFPIENMVKLRKLWSGFDGHPNRLKLPGIELSSGSLGQGLGVAVGSAMNAKLENKDYRVYCIMGDGEQQEGSIWESAMCAAHYKLDNLVGIVDRNKLQIDGSTEQIMNIEPIVDKYRAFGWNVIVIDGHDVRQITKAFEEAEKIKGKPTVIIADTVKGKCVSYAENVVGYHGSVPKEGRAGKESLDTALCDIGCGSLNKEKVDELYKIANDYQKEIDRKIENILPVFKKNYWWNAGTEMKVEMESTRMGFGKAIEKLGGDKKTVVLCADVTGSICMDKFYKGHPDRENRFFNMGVAEQNMTVVGSGLAKEGKTAFIGSYGVFVTGRNMDQIRTTVCYNNYNVKIADAHSGISVGPDGATHQALEEISCLYYLPNIHMVVPCDSQETEKATEAIAKVEGPGVIRYGRGVTPVITRKETPYVFGIANVIRYRGKENNFIDAFETKLSTEYKSEKEDLSIIACGPMVTEAMRAAYILKEEFGIETRVLCVHTVKPADKKALTGAAEETGAVLTVEEHQVGGFGNIVAGIISQGKAYNSPLLIKMIGVQDKFGETGEPWDLMKLFGLTAEFIVQDARKLYQQKKS